MPRKRRPEPPLLQTNDVLIAMVGTAAWAVALVVLLLIGLPEPDRWWPWVCVVGIGIGLFGVWYIPRLHRSRAAAQARHEKAPETHHEDGDGSEDSGGQAPPRRRGDGREAPRRQPHR